MNIGVIGSGNIGANAARLFAAAGHQVAISNLRGPETLGGLVEEIGFAPVDVGTLAESRRQEPGSPAYTVAMNPAQAREMLAGMG